MLLLLLRLFFCVETMLNSTDCDPQIHSDCSLKEKPSLYFPECSDDIKPFVGRYFSTLEQDIQCYRMYGGVCGFDVRLGTVTKVDGVIMFRYILCNREGKSINGVAAVHDGCKKRRKRMSTRFSCMAHVVFKFSGNQGYVITIFNEGHSHPLVSNGYKQFIKLNRRLDYGHHSFLLNYVRSNMGPMKSFRLFKELVGSYENVGCSGVDFKNFSRDLRAYVLGVDAQTVLDNLRRRYNLIFTHFTGNDNHGRCVTFAAGLLSKEDVDSYSWLFEKFLECMDKKNLNLLITDQDPTIKLAVGKIFPLPATCHRFGMWHMMIKVANKIPSSLREDEVFCKKFNALVWSEVVEPTNFQNQWIDILEKFNLLDHNWFSAMYDLRFFWISAYFRDLHMGGLFHTTSMSESENSFFRKYLNRHANSIEFLMHFGSALDSQRHVQKQLSSVDESSFPLLETQLPIEKHAASVYTYRVFRDVQRKY